ncbi:DNA-directed RNA polymerases I, II, and III subunit RPABC3 [Blastocladiella emersonii ATCC 22665]|nr:DNA-directed RNA polymerases I, II, and III subunit RPABC3 [Blastocladiella emersonii ATCC 22665]
MSRNDALLFSDMFAIKDVDADGKRFDRVSRLNASSDNYHAELTLDFNNELYPLKAGEKFTLTLTTSLALNGAQTVQRDSWRDKLPTDDRDLSDEFDYVCHGRCYKFEEENNSMVSVYISFGGLLLRLMGEAKHLQNFRKGESIYLLMRK